MHIMAQACFIAGSIITWSMFMLIQLRQCVFRDIQTLWRIAGQRYQTTEQQLQVTVGSYSIYDDLPTDLDQVSLPSYLFL